MITSKKEYLREWRKKNPDKNKIYVKKYYQTHPLTDEQKSHRRECRRKYRQIPGVKEQQKTKHKEWCIKNYNKRSNYHKEYWVTNKESKKIYRKNWSLTLKLKIYNHYSNNDIKCNCCGENMIEFLSIDHINNDGATERKKFSNSTFYTYIVKNNFPSGYQILCMNCNFAKGKNKDHICPHKIKIDEILLK